MERTFQILAVILIGVAAFFAWTGNADAVCFFLSIRFEIGERVKRRKAEEDLAAEKRQ
jgi:hypothetical protein